MDIGREGKTWVKADSPSPELPSEPPADLTSVQMPEACKGLQGGVTSLGWRLECSALPPPNPSGLAPSCFSDKEAEQLWSQSCNTYLHTWMAHIHRSQPHGSCQCIGDSFTKFLLWSKDTKSNLPLLVLLFGKFISKIPCLPWLWSTTLTDMLVQGGWNHWGCMGQGKELGLPAETCTDWTTGVNLKWCSWAELSTSVDTFSLTDFS